MDYRQIDIRTSYLEYLFNDLPLIAANFQPYLDDYPTVPALAAGLERYFTFYNYERPHQSLAYATPAAVHFGC